MSTNSISPFGAPAAAGAPIEGSMDSISLSPEALLAYCSGQLDRLDSQIQGMMNDQKHSNQIGDSLNAIGATFDKYPDGVDFRANGKSGDDSSDADNASDVKADNDIASSIRAEMQKMPADSPQRARLDAIATTFEQAAKGTGIVNKDDVTGYAGEIKNMSSSTQTNDQMNMAEMQSIVAKRSTALQLMTNMLQSVEDSSKSIASNVGK